MSPPAPRTTHTTTARPGVPRRVGTRRRSSRPDVPKTTADLDADILSLRTRAAMRREKDKMRLAEHNKMYYARVDGIPGKLDNFLGANATDYRRDLARERRYFIELGAREEQAALLKRRKKGEAEAKIDHQLSEMISSHWRNLLEDGERAQRKKLEQQLEENARERKILLHTQARADVHLSNEINKHRAYLDQQRHMLRMMEEGKLIDHRAAQREMVLSAARKVDVGGHHRPLKPPGGRAMKKRSTLKRSSSRGKRGSLRGSRRSSESLEEESEPADTRIGVASAHASKDKSRVNIYGNSKTALLFGGGGAPRSGTSSPSLPTVVGAGPPPTPSASDTRLTTMPKLMTTAMRGAGLDHAYIADSPRNAKVSVLVPGSPPPRSSSALKLPSSSPSPRRGRSPGPGVTFAI